MTIYKRFVIGVMLKKVIALTKYISIVNKNEYSFRVLQLH